MSIPLPIPTFIPYNDNSDVRYRSLPLGTIALIVLNITVHLIMLDYDPIEQAMRWRVFGSVSEHYETMWGLPGFSAISAVFLHGGELHLIFNMIFLWAFGKRVEDACGTARFLAFYLTAGLMGNLLTTLAFALGLTQDGLTPGIGASGAIAGVMGAYFILFPGTKISGLIAFNFFCILPIPYRVRLPAVVPLFIFLAQQVYFSYQSVQEDYNYGVGFLAHLGGFISGLFIFLYLRKDVLYRYWTKADL